MFQGDEKGELRLSEMGCFNVTLEENGLNLNLSMSDDPGNQNLLKEYSENVSVE